MTEAEFLAIEAAVRRAPAVRARARAPRASTTSRSSTSTPSRPDGTAFPEEQGGRPARARPRLRPARAGRQRVRAPARGHLRPRRRPHRRARALRGPRPGAAAGRARRVPRRPRGPLRDDVRPIHISQPEGPSFAVDGHEVRWQKWRLPGRLQPARGPRPPRRRLRGRRGPAPDPASARRYAEMVVPYADPDRFYQAPLDIGEFNVGTMTNSLTLGCDCLGVIHYFDGAWCNADGAPVVVPERDLPPRGGRRDAVEAHRLPHRPRRGAPARAGS